LEVEAITEDNEYHAMRIRITCYLENIRNIIQVQIGFGDAVTSNLSEEGHANTGGANRAFFILCELRSGSGPMEGIH
jgi:hypothetical protein